MKKFERKDKNEKRRLAFEKRNAKKEMNLARYGAEGGSALVMAKTGEFNRRFVAAFTALLLLLSSLIWGIVIIADADDIVSESDMLFLNKNELDSDGFKMLVTPNNENGMYLSKGLRNNGNGSYDLKLEAYATGNTEKVPTDFVLVLDQSGSMSTVDMPTGSYSRAGDSWSVSDIANSNTAYYYKDDDGQYYRVYAKRGYMYYQVNAGNNYKYMDDLFNKYRYFHYFVDETIRSNGYYYCDGNGDYWPVVMQVDGSAFGIGEGNALAYNCWLYYLDDTDTLYEIHNDLKDRNYYVYRQIAYSRRAAELIGLTSDYVDHPLFNRFTGYNELCYKDSDGNEHSLAGPTEYCNSNGIPVTEAGGTTEIKYNKTLYIADNKESRLAALNTAAKSFIDKVADQKNTDGTSVDHRVAVVGFASENSNNYYYNNNELLSPHSSVNANNTNFYGASYDSSGTINLNPNGYRITGWDGPQFKSSDITTAYSNALVRASTETGRTSLKKSIDYVTAYGGTQPQIGFEMAYNVLNHRSSQDKKYIKINGDEAERNTVVIFFTDGRPGNYNWSNQYEVANLVVNKAADIKDLGASIYSIGVFGESDGEPLTYAKYWMTDDDSDYSGRQEGTYYSYKTLRGNNNDDTYEALKEMYINEPETVSYVITSDASHGHYSWLSWVNYEDMYVLSRIWKPKTNGYSNPPTDTISDYMRTVSSEYPAATGFVEPFFYGGNSNSNYSSYDAMVEGLRGEKAEGKYYFLATNTAALTKAFTDIFISESSSTVNYTPENSFFRDVITDYFDTSTASVEVKTMKVDDFDDDGMPISWSDSGSSPDGAFSEWSAGEKTINVDGFNFSKFYVSPENVDTANNNLSRKMVVIISGLMLTQSGLQQVGKFASNTDKAGIYRKAYVDSDNISHPDVNENPFLIPSTERFTYTLNVEGVNKDPKLLVQLQLWDENGMVTSVPADFKIYQGSSSATSWTNKEPTGFSEITLTNGTITWKASDLYGITNLLIEDLPEGYYFKAAVTNNDSSGAYTYSLDLDGNQIPDFYDTVTDNAFSMPRENSIIHIDSIANNRDVTFHLDADESPFVDTSYEFKVDLVLSGDSITSKLDQINAKNTGITFEIDGNTLKGTLTMPVSSLDNGKPVVPSVVVKVPDGAMLTVEHSDPFYTTETPFKYTDENTPTQTDYSPRSINTATDIYIVDTVNNDVGAGVTEDNNGSRAIIYALSALTIISGGAGAAYVYRKKDEFLVQ